MTLARQTGLLLDFPSVFFSSTLQDIDSCMILVSIVEKLAISESGIQIFFINVKNILRD